MRALLLSPVLVCALALVAAPADATPMGWSYWQPTPTIHSWFTAISSVGQAGVSRL